MICDGQLSFEDRRFSHGIDEVKLMSRLILTGRDYCMLTLCSRRVSMSELTSPTISTSGRLLSSQKTRASLGSEAAGHSTGRGADQVTASA
jgi:hypothetical protein